MNIEKNCKACGDLITVRLTDHKRGWGNYCDKACAAAYKCGQRPRDVNAGHAKTSKWAEDRMNAFSRYKGGKPPVAKTVKEQVGKNAKIGPKPVRVNIDENDDSDRNGKSRILGKS